MSAYRNFYLAIENVALPAAKRTLLFTEFAAIGAASAQPQKTDAWRIRADNDAAIFEVMYNEDNFCAKRALDWLGELFGIAVAQITVTTAVTTYTTGISSFAVTLSSGGAERVKFIALGGLETSWTCSSLECLGYMNASGQVWNEPPEDE